MRTGKGRALQQETYKTAFKHKRTYIAKIHVL